MPREILHVTEYYPESNHILYTITSNRERTRYYINDSTGKRLDSADTPMKFEPRIGRIRAIASRRYG